MRPLSSDAIAAIAAGFVARRNAIWFDVGPGYGLWDDIDDLVLDGSPGRTFIGRAGQFTMSPLPSVADGSVQGCDVVFSGVNQTVFPFLQNEHWHQQYMEALLVFMHPATREVLDVRLWFAGTLDVADVQDGPETSLLVRAESTSRDIDRPGTATRSEASQRRIAPTDGFFKHVAKMKTTEIWWGRLPPNPPGGR